MALFNGLYQEGDHQNWMSRRLCNAWRKVQNPSQQVYCVFVRRPAKHLTNLGSIKNALWKKPCVWLKVKKKTPEVRKTRKPYKTPIKLSNHISKKTKPTIEKKENKTPDEPLNQKKGPTKERKPSSHLEAFRTIITVASKGPEPPPKL